MAHIAASAARDPKSLTGAVLLATREPTDAQRCALRVPPPHTEALADAPPRARRHRACPGHSGNRTAVGSALQARGRSLGGDLGGDLGDATPGAMRTLRVRPGRPAAPGGAPSPM